MGFKKEKINLAILQNNYPCKDKLYKLNSCNSPQAQKPWFVYLVKRNFKPSIYMIFFNFKGLSINRALAHWVTKKSDIEFLHTRLFKEVT